MDSDIESSVRVAFLILAHENIENVKNLVNKLIRSELDCEVFIHFDKRSPVSEYRDLQVFCKEKQHCSLLDHRISCDWGGYSLVQASLELLKTVFKTKPFDFFYLMSASCCPVSSLSDLKLFLSKHKHISFIEVHSSDWILDGMRDDRYRYYHLLNFRKHPMIFRFMYRVQKYLRITRSLPNNIQEIKFGSQWWCLSHSSVDKILKYLDAYPQIYKFFSSVWIPDECFFQTLVWHVDRENFISQTLTYYEFDQDGKPLVFRSIDDIDIKKLNSKYFARKIENCT